MIVDAHQHIWDLRRASYPWMDPDDPVLARDRTIDEAIAELDAAGVDGTVLVQSADDPADSETMFDAARATSRVRGVVAWVPLGDVRVAERLLDRWSRERVFCGIRTLIHTLDDPDWLASPEAADGLALLAERGIPFDVVAVNPRHLRASIAVGERLPGLHMVLDHLAHPPVRAADDGVWAELIAEAAANPNTHAKVSGLYATAGAMDAWSAGDVAPFFDRAIDLFGAHRLMFGGDWPICDLGGGYAKVRAELGALIDRCAPEDRARIWAGTATEFYRLDARTSEARAS